MSRREQVPRLLVGEIGFYNPIILKFDFRIVIENPPLCELVLQLEYTHIVAIEVGGAIRPYHPRYYGREEIVSRFPCVEHF